MIGISNYSGVFDGNYKTVSGLYSKVLGRDLGFFGKVLGTVKNVGVIDSYFGGTGGSIGSVAASLHSDGTIQNCYFDGQICATLANASLGGIIGYGNNGCTIINCFNYGRVTSTDNDCRVGAIVGNQRRQQISFVWGRTDSPLPYHSFTLHAGDRTGGRSDA